MDLEKEDLPTRLLQLDRYWKQKKRMIMQNFILVYGSTVAKCFLFFLLLCCLSHSLPQFCHRFWPKFGLPEKIPSPRAFLWSQFFWRQVGTFYTINTLGNPAWPPEHKGCWQHRDTMSQPGTASLLEYFVCVLTLPSIPLLPPPSTTTSCAPANADHPLAVWPDLVISRESGVFWSKLARKN